MRNLVLAHVDAVSAVLREAGFRVHLVEVSEANPVFPYVVVWTRQFVPESVSLGDERSVLESSVMVTMTADTVRNALTLQGKVRDVLDGARLSVPGRAVEPLRLNYEVPCATDKDVTLPGTGRHPAFCVDSWRIISVKDSGSGE